jgi:hypothetical protein
VGTSGSPGAFSARAFSREGPGLAGAEDEIGGLGAFFALGVMAELLELFLGFFEELLQALVHGRVHVKSFPVISRLFPQNFKTIGDVGIDVENHALHFLILLEYRHISNLHMYKTCTCLLHILYRVKHIRQHPFLPATARTPAGRMEPTPPLDRAPGPL